LHDERQKIEKRSVLSPSSTEHINKSGLNGSNSKPMPTTTTATVLTEESEGIEHAGKGS
jgi:hypothetical protein